MRQVDQREIWLVPRRILASSVTAPLFNGASFPSSAWERKSGKLCFPWNVRVQDDIVARGCEAELGGGAFASGAWGRENEKPTGASPWVLSFLQRFCCRPGRRRLTCR